MRTWSIVATDDDKQWPFPFDDFQAAFRKAAHLMAMAGHHEVFVSINLTTQEAHFWKSEADCDALGTTPAIAIECNGGPDQ